MTGSIAHEDSVKEVNWAMSEAYKMAVQLAGITDWSVDDPRGTRVAQVEIMQVEIAKMILNSLHKRLFK